MIDSTDLVLLLLAVFCVLAFPLITWPLLDMVHQVIDRLRYGKHD